MHGLQPRTGRRRARPLRRRDSRRPRARAVHDRRDAVERRAAATRSSTACAPAASRSARSTPRPTRVTAGTSTARSSAPASTVIRGRRRSSPTCSIRRIPRARTSAPTGAGTTRCTSSATCGPTRRCCCACATASSTSRPAGARAPSFGYPLAWCFAEGEGRVFSTSLGHFPAAWESPTYLRHLAGGLGWALGEPA